MGKTLKCAMFGLLLVVIAISVGCGTQAPEAEETSQVPQAADPFIGTWQLNVEKSTFDPGPPPRSSTVIFEDRGDGMILRTAEGINAQGDRTFEQIAFKRDGKDYPVVILGAEAPQSLSVELVDAYTEEVVSKVDGKVNPITISAAVSSDGKTLTEIVKRTDAQGQQTNVVAVFERQ